MTTYTLPCSFCGGQTGHAICRSCRVHIPALAGQFWTNPTVEAEADRTGDTPNYGPDDVRLYCDACYPKAQ